MSDVTRILNAIERGDAKATDELLPLVYEELRLLAAQKLSHEPPGQTLQATALVHEAYIRPVGDESQAWENRGHFFAAGAEAMRRILVENARRKQSLKRGGWLRRVDLDGTAPVDGSESAATPLIAVDEALLRLARQDRVRAELVKLRYFAGLMANRRPWPWAFPPPRRTGTGSMPVPGCVLRSSEVPNPTDADRAFPQVFRFLVTQGSTRLSYCAVKAAAGSPTMTGERKKNDEAIFYAALEQPLQAARAAYVKEACGADWLMMDAVEGKLVTELSRSLCSEAVITDGDWHDIGVTWDGSACTLYMDDVLEAESAESGLADSAGGVVIGCEKTVVAGTFFSGLIDGARLYNRAVKP